MAIKGFGTLASLGKILEDALTPGSRVREDKDKKEAKPKPSQSDAGTHKKKVLDPKRKAWHDKRLQEQARVPQPVAPAAPPPPTASRAVTRKTAADAGNGLLSALAAAAKEAKPKDGSKRPEAWKRKPGDPIF
jgi:hypothetical protein